MMDDLNPYTDEYTGYGDAYTGAPETSNIGSVSTNDSENVYEQSSVAEINDPRRYFEINVPESVQYPEQKSHRKNNSIPLTAVLADSGRVSIHPLGIIEKTSGNIRNTLEFTG